jgi:hypothetical protein|tara:strand:+ start:351 stop:1136 length:786 start_codon:yes stop_codon:yes gene_type:complete
MYTIKKIDYRVATLFVQERHYSPVMPKLTKHYLGAYLEDELVGVLTLGWGTRPMHTIAKLFPELGTSDYYEIGKMCMDEDQPRNSESQLLSQTIKWMKKNTPERKYLFTWADGIVGKAGYVYQSANFLYGGFIWSDIYVTEKGEKVHPRTMGKYIKGARPTFEERVNMRIDSVFGKQFRYIYPLTKKDRKYLRTHSTVEWGLDYPKDKDLRWKIKPAGCSSYTLSDDIPFVYDGTSVDYNSRNVNKVKDKWGSATLEEFLL